MICIACAEISACLKTDSYVLLDCDASANVDFVLMDNASNANHSKFSNRDAICTTIVQPLKLGIEDKQLEGSP